MAEQGGNSPPGHWPHPALARDNNAKRKGAPGQPHADAHDAPGPSPAAAAVHETMGDATAPPTPALQSAPAPGLASVTEGAGGAGPAAADAAPPPADPATLPMDVDQVPPLQQAAGGGSVEQGFGTQDTGALGGGEAPLASDAASVPPPAPSVEPATSIGASELQNAAMGFCPKKWRDRGGAVREGRCRRGYWR